MFGAIVAALGGLVALGRLVALAPPFQRMQRFCRSAPWPISWILEYACWALVLAAVVVFVALAIAFTVRAGIMILGNTVWFTICSAGNSLIAIGSMLASWDSVAGLFNRDVVLPMLPPVGALGDGPTIQWTIQDSLVAATEATQHGVQDLLRRCAMSKTPVLQLDSNTSIPCEGLSRQLDSPPLMTTLRRRSISTHETVSGELAREFRDFGRFLHLLRDSPASAALDPQKPRRGFSSSWESVQHRLTVAYRTVWCRWVLRQPASTLQHRNSRLLTLLRAGLEHRKAWESAFAALKEQMETKYEWSCPKLGCQSIERVAQKLGPASFSPSSLVEVQGPLRAGAGGKEQVQGERPPESDEKDLVEQQERSFELQKLAAKCVTKCTLFKEHKVALDGLLAWLEAEIGWWTRFRQHQTNSSSELMAEKFDMSLPADILRFEILLDKVARTAMGREGPQ